MRILRFFALLLLSVASGVSAQPSAITITSPAPYGLINNPSSFTVTGTATSVFEGNVVVQALDQTYALLAEQAVIAADASLGGTGPWSATLSVSITPGASGFIRAFSTSPDDGRVVAEAFVEVQYGLETFTPSSIIINTPRNAELLPNAGSFLVEGTATNIFEGSLLVQARSEDGTVLSQQSVTAPGAMSGTGNWTATMTVNVPPGSPGVIRAYAVSPMDSSVVAESIINVQYGMTGEADTQIKITTPTSGTSVPTGSSGVSVSGTSNDLMSGQVLVQLLDGAANLIVERTVNTSATSGPGTWSSFLPARFASDTSGSIVATAVGTAPLLYDQIHVTFQANCTIPSDWPTYTVVPGDTLNAIARRIGSTVEVLSQANCLNNPSLISVGQVLHIPHTAATAAPTTAPTAPPLPTAEAASIIIQDPMNHSAFAIGTPIIISGTATGLPQPSLSVQALDASNNILSSQSAAVDSTNGFWQAPLLVNVAEGTTGRIVAFATSPEDGSVVATGSINVTYGTDIAIAALRIVEPAPMTSLDLSTPITISGEGANLFEGNVVVRALDHSGQVLAEEPTTITADGTWSLTLSLSAGDGAPGILYAYAQSPADGSIMVADAIGVMYGSPEAAEPLIIITDPFPYSTVRGDDDGMFSIGGTGLNLSGHQLNVEIMDANSGALLAGPFISEITDDSNTWQLNAPLPEGVTRARLHAQLMDGGAVVASFITEAWLGDPDTTTQPFIIIHGPLTETAITTGGMVGISGVSGNLETSTITVQVINEEGLVLVAQTVPVIDSATGYWEALLSLTTATPDTTGRIMAFNNDSEYGMVVARDSVNVNFSMP